MAAAFHRHRRRHRQRPGRGVRRHGHACWRSAKRDIALFIEPGDIVEQSSEDIWRAVCASVRDGGRRSRRSRPRDRSPASASTRPVRWSCSGKAARRCRSAIRATASATSSSGWIIARIDQARRINADRPRTCCDYVGGTISPEMETPKLLWLTENLPETFAARLAVLRPDRLSDLAGDRQPGALDLHA